LYRLAMHQRIHPLFADDYLATIDLLPIDHPVNRHAPSPEPHNPYLPHDLGVWTTVDLVLRGTDGTIVSLGVLRSSGLDEFDAAVLETFERAAPYGAPPMDALSVDGNFYLEWTFYRSPLVSCSPIDSFSRRFR
jgi:TonB family protein